MSTDALAAAIAARRAWLLDTVRALAQQRLILPLLLATTALSHAYHLFAYPFYLGDEGIYMEQAWAVLKGKGLAPYTYFYDHAPVGWLLLAAWLRMLPHGVYQWGMAVNSGRVLMLLVSVASTALLYRIASRFTGSSAVGALAGLIFALSPLSLYYGRMVLLDNIMVLWLLLAIDLLTEGEGLFALMGSGAAFGLAVLTKENAIFFAPALGVVLYFASRERHFYRFGIWGWLYTAIAVVSIYPLYALLKGELLGTAAFLVSPHGGHVNLLGAVEWQLSRSASHGSIIDYPHGQFWDFYFHSWAAKDAFITTAGVTATVFNVGVALADARLRRHYLMAAALCLSFALYLARGAVLLEFYIVPLLPFLALNIALAVHAVLRPLGRRLATVALLGMAGALALVFTQVEQTGRDAFTVGQTDVQVAQLSYVRAHIPARARMMIDDDLWVDLHDSGGGLYPVYRHADSHWKIAGDPAVRDVVFRRDWRRVDYVIASDQMPTTLIRDTTDHYHLALNAYVHSIPVWRDSLGGVTVEIRKVASKPALYRVWLRQQRRLERVRSKPL